MTDSHDDDPAERPEPVLVRPYVGNTPAQSRRDPADAPTVVQPAIVDDTPVAPAPEPPRRGGLARALGLRLLALVLGVVLAAAVAGYLILAPKTDDNRPGAALPGFTAPRITDPGEPSGRPSASRPSPSKSPSTSPSASVSASAPVSSAPVSPSLSPSATLAPPGSDRTGSITAASGRCLALGGLLGLDGSPVTVAGCAGVASQEFTLTTDGTLRVSGRCAAATGDGTVRVGGCGDGSAAQWRSGPSGTLVNPATGNCLTDPGQAGGTTKISACTGAADQTWSLP